MVKYPTVKPKASKKKDVLQKARSALKKTDNPYTVSSIKRKLKNKEKKP